ncbi:MAG TPA: acyltransferase [Catalimonadaceae bacterium]|nr:acyltransferase [Catalimonadaceae bacterium]
MSRNNPSLPGNRISFIDSVRGVAACLVLLQHTYEHFFPETGELLGKQFINFGQVGVVAFFLVSGFIIPYSLEKSRSVWHFFVNRIFRIYPLYLFIIFLQFILILTHIRVEDSFSPGKILISHLFFLQEYFPESSSWSLNLVIGSWTLFIEAIWYVLFAILFLVQIPHKWLMRIAILGFSLLIIASFVLEKRFPMGRMGMLFNCILGLHFYRWFKGEISDNQFYAGFGVSLIAILSGLWQAYGYFLSEHFSALCVLTSWSVSFIFFTSLFVIRDRSHALWDSVFGFLGNISYSVYLSHFTIMKIMTHFFGETPLIFVLTVLLTIVFSKYSFQLIEKPGIALGKNLFKRGS